MKVLKTFFMIIGVIGFCFALFIFFDHYRENSIIFLSDKTKDKEVENTETEKPVIFENETIFINDDQSNPCTNYEQNLEYYKNEVSKTFINSQEVTSFIYYDISTGYTFSYNDNTEMLMASTIKAALAIYIYDLIEKKQVSLDQELTYTANFYNGGSGVLKNKNVGTKYTIKQLIDYMIIDSDNIAYLMLLNNFDYTKVQAFWYNLGTKTTYKKSNTWGTTTAQDSLIYMKKLYQFYREKASGPELMLTFKKALFRNIDFSEKKEIEIAHKSGFESYGDNDLAIIFDKNPFIYIVLTRKDGNNDNSSFFHHVTDDIYAFHQYYWNNINCKY